MASELEFRNNPHIDEDMKLPMGKVCLHCVQWTRWCKQIIGIHALNEVCDYAPSRFQEVSNAKNSKE